LGESSLHAAIKTWYARPGDRLEVSIDGYFIDIQRGDLLVEIQTRNFAQIKHKLVKLLGNHPVRLVHPIAQEKWIIRLPSPGSSTTRRRKSPRRGRVEHLFNELIRFPELVNEPNFSIEVLLTREEEVLANDGLGSWRRKGWSITDRKLVAVIDRIPLESRDDFTQLLPDELPNPFTVADLSAQIPLPRRLAQKMAYCLRRMEVISLVGKRGNAYLYEFTN
jgi:hypothetical protein